jgi:hypothetical protein
MPVNDRKLLDVLKCELSFLARGGYRRSIHAPSRAPLIFEESPTCSGYYREESAHPCNECLLQRFVPTEMRDRKLACRYVPLNAEGDSLDVLYRFAYEPEIEEAVGCWLESAIALLEQQLESEKEASTGVMR